MISNKNLRWIIVGIALLGAAILASFVFGAQSVPLSKVFRALFHIEDNSFLAKIVRERIPRTVFCIIAGGSLGVSGALMQSVTRNPIADPSILGVNTGASLLVVVGIAFFHIATPFAYIWFALAGAAVTAVFVYGIGSMGTSGATPIKLALAGAATSAALSSFISAIILQRQDVMNAFRFWQVGSVSGADWSKIIAVLPFFLFGLLCSIFVAPGLDAMALGDEMATGLGVKTRWIRIISALAGVILCGATTALAGPIGFVGLMVPHAVRLLFGSGMRKLMPLSALFGAILLTFADVIGRVAGSPGELEAGIVTAFLGAPVLILIAIKQKGKSI